ncbi:nitronate monooxygenase [Candidatus Bathyarchaeota archaeon]|nr:nitronate monooxygenase [Candidatus Bathyarchaeota archaeon]
MLHTKVCDLLKIDYPIIQAGMGAFTSVELVTAVSNAGGLGILGITARPIESLASEIKKVRQLTDRPFGVNYLVTNYSEEAFELCLQLKVPVISTALGDPGKLVKRTHDVGALHMHQVHTRSQATQAKERGVDIIVAQGFEAGGYGQWVSSLPLIPQLVEAVKPTPVLAAGGIVDGRGVAAALILGAQGVVMGTRFLASIEAPIGDGWKQMIIHSESEDTVKTDFINELLPNGALGYVTVPRALRTDFIEKWDGKKEEVKKNADQLRQEIGLGIMQRRNHEFIPFTGQSTGLIREILPAAEIVKRVVTESRSIFNEAHKLGIN